MFEAAIQAKATKTPSTTDTWRMDHDEARPHNGHAGDLESLVRWGIGSGELAVAAD